MSAPTNWLWLREANTVYALNTRGYKVFAAVVQAAHTTNDDELIAVAQLMKAAPDLLAQLEACAVHIAATRGNSDPYAVAAFAAIAKATGEQP